MEHKISSYMEQKIDDSCVEKTKKMAVAMAMGTIHKLYDEYNDDCHLSELNMRNLKMSLQVIQMAQTIK